MDEAVPRPEHPRPDFRRPAWRSLNGWWNFAFDPERRGEREDWPRARVDWPLRIRVPFPWQATLSGLAARDYQGAAWYHRTFAPPADWAGGRVWLCFGAVDHDAAVWVNGERIGDHEGGYTPFAFDITALLRDGENRLVVQAVDETGPEQLTGKQTGWYTPSGGIWQTVWLERRPATFLRAARFLYDGDGVALHAQIEAAQAGSAALRIAPDPDEPDGAPLSAQVFALSLPAGASSHVCPLRLPTPRLWSPDRPDLYFVRLTLNSAAGESDEVAACFGLRTVGTGAFAGQPFRAVTLNGEPLYIRGALHQSFHPDGLYTYPDDAAIRSDLQQARAFGFNLLRLHIKLDEPRLLHWADRLGVALICDLPNFTRDTPTARRRWEAALRAAVERDCNHPAILAWCLFNESWGLGNEEYKRHPERQAWVAEMTQLARRLGPARLIEDNSPCFYDHVDTDINSWHCYINDYAAARDHLADVVAQTAPGSSFNYVPGRAQGDAPLLNSEYGGIGAGSGQQDISWCLKFLTNELRKHAKIAGYVYTELCDIEWEHNGVLTYDRVPKVFGYDEVSPGMTPADLHRADFVVLDAPPLTVAAPGTTVSLPVLISHFGPDVGGRGRLRYHIAGWDALGRYREVQAGEREVAFARWTVTPQEPLRFAQPPLLTTISVQLETLDGALLARNYTQTNGLAAPLPEVATLDDGSVAVRWSPRAVAASTWPQPATDSDKFHGEGAGELSYHVALPAALRAGLSGATLIVEAAAFAGRGKVVWSDTPYDYPQTGALRWPSTVAIVWNGVEAATIALPDDPADARGALSHAAGVHPGSYGYLTRVAAPPQALAAMRSDGAARITLRAGDGGLAVFGQTLGRYPLPPTLVLTTTTRLPAAG